MGALLMERFRCHWKGIGVIHVYANVCVLQLQEVYPLNFLRCSNAYIDVAWVDPLISDWKLHMPLDRWMVYYKVVQLFVFCSSRSC
jgi:hypothetical protein